MKQILYIRIFLLVSLLFGTCRLHAQTFSGLPYSICGKVKKTSSFLEMTSVDADTEIAANDQEYFDNREKIMQYGKALSVDIDLYTMAKIDTLNTGEVVYQVGIYCPNALSINVVFDSYHLKTGTRMYLVGAQTNTYIGAYTSLNNSEAKVLGTELLKDSKLIIELIEPAANIGTSLLHVNSVIHGYRSLETLIKRAFNTSGICNIDVNCPQGKGFEKQRNSVAMLINSSGGFCTGTLMNTTAGPFKPYVLSAYHCGTNPASWVFRFRWESPAEFADCGTVKPSVDGPKDKSINGATLVASYKTTDFILCELNATPNTDWDVFYAGWDKTGNIPQEGTGIHHPIADIKKIALDFEPLCSDAFNKGEPLNHWRTNWNQGITESGSSGSPLFDHNHRVVGQLHGGDSDCISKFLTDYYGKLSESWVGGGTPSTRLQDWLDPISSNADVLDGSKLPNLDPFLTFNSTNLHKRLCEDSIVPYVIISNGGSDSLKTLQLKYVYDTDSIQTVSWKGALTTYAKDTVFFPAKKFTKGTHVFSVTIIQTPDLVGDDVSNNTVSSSFEVLQHPRKFTFDLQLDTEGDETVWYVIDTLKKVWYTGGPYLQTSQKPANIHEEFCLDPSCYTISVYDFNGDGMYVSDTNVGSYSLLDDSNNVVAQLLPENAKFGSSFSKKFCYSLPQSFDDTSNLFVVFPNPSNKEYVTINSENQVIKQVEIYSVTGQLISITQVNAKASSIPILQLQAGMYYVRIVGVSSEITKPFVRY